MLSIIALSLFDLLILLRPPKPFRLILELMQLPLSARMWLAAFVTVNIVVSGVFEKWVTPFISQVIGAVLSYRLEQKRYRDGKAYKAVEGGMR